MTTPHAAGVQLDLTAVPWSRRGSYMTLTMNVERRDHPGRDNDVEPGLYLGDVSGLRLWRWNGVFLVLGIDGDRFVTPEVTSATYDLLVLSVGSGIVEVTWEGADTMRFRSTGAGLRFVQSVIDPMDAALAFPTGTDAWRLQMGEDAHYVVTRISGLLSVDAPNVRTGDADTVDRKVIDMRPGTDGIAEIALTQYEAGYVAPASRPSFEECRLSVQDELATWSAGFPALSADLVSTGDAATALLWSSTVGPRGLLGRPGILMSKNWMNAIWSWDHCFNALGLAAGDKGLAWDQFVLLFDHQHRDGMLPDLIHDNGRMWGFCKPPVHGWTLRHLIEADAVPAGELDAIYPKLVAWTEWWFTYRDLDRDGLCEYFHGCDSGQDNSSAFDGTGFPAASPDLAAFLVIQMDVLADVAMRLGRETEAAEWSRRADEHLALMLDLLWNGESFCIRRGSDGTTGRTGASQVFVLPMLLGDRLPEPVREALVREAVDGGLLTAHGVASESPRSVAYEPDGYWRGPIWAPTTYLVIEGLRACGRSDLAETVATRFLDTVRRGGFAENFEATTGLPLRDRGYSWSASVFLILARERATQGG